MIPYSEHSSFDELKNFIKAIRPKRIIPTVNAHDGTKVEKMLTHFIQV